MGMTARTGYVHALEGVIAALIVVVYLNSIVSVPQTTDWESAQVSKESEDLVAALDDAGVLDRLVLRDDPDSFNAFVTSLSDSLSYSIRVSGLPKPFITVGVLADNASTTRTGTVQQQSRPPGAPLSVDGSGYRTGTVTGDGFNSLDIVLTDTVDNGIAGFTTVNLDLDGDGDFGGTGEGPFNFSDRFACNAADAGCTVTETYEVGPFNTSLPLYNASTAAELAAAVPRLGIGRRTVDLTYDAVNPFDERLNRFDVLWIEDWTAAEIAERDAIFRDFLRTGRMLLVHSAVDKPRIDDNYLGSLGFDYLQGYTVKGSDTANVLYSLHGPRNASYRAAQYYLDGGLRIDTFTGSGGADTATFTVRGTPITARRYGDVVAFSTESFSVNHSTGTTVQLEGNTYRIDSITPLVLEPSGQQRFNGFGTERINADYHLTRMQHRTYNISEYDTEATYSDQYQNRSDLPEDYSEGPVNTPCDWEDYPYRVGDVTVDSTTYTYITVNFEAQRPCDGYYEFLYIDINDDGDVDDDSLPASSREGPHQDGDRVNISSQVYEVSLGLNGTRISLERVGQRRVGEIPVVQDVFGRGGAAALVRRQSLGTDDTTLLATLVARETQERQEFTRPRSLGDTSVGYTWLSSAGRKTLFGYTLDTVWWYR